MDFKNKLIEKLNLSQIQAETLYKTYIDACKEIAEEYHAEQSILNGVGIMFTEKEKQVLVDLIKTEGRTTVMNYSDRKWIDEYVNDRNKLIEKIKSQP